MSPFLGDESPLRAKLEELAHMRFHLRQNWDRPRTRTGDVHYIRMAPLPHIRTRDGEHLLSSKAGAVYEGGHRQSGPLPDVGGLCRESPEDQVDFSGAVWL